MSGSIFLLRQGEQLVEMVGQPYESEDLLQDILASHPRLLAGEQIDPADPRRWLLVSREMGVAAEESGSDRWSVDHLFLDQDAIPTIVEVKRGSDTRIRREVVGQMLDYAANATLYWPIEGLRARFEATCVERDRDPEGEVRGLLLADDADVEQFWTQVKTNLQAGKVRLIFLSDTIPPELLRVVEFLNAQMDPAEVLALEVKHFAGADLRTLVPRLLGQTARKRDIVTTPSEKRQWDHDSFMAALAERRGAQAAQTAQRLVDWAKGQQLRLWWGTGKQDGSFIPMCDHAGSTYWTFALWTYGAVEIQFAYMLTKPPFDDEQRRLQVLEALNRIEGVTLPPARIAKRPTFPIGVLGDETRLAQFLQIMDEMLATIRSL